jgi:hypothetical protein
VASSVKVGDQRFTGVHRTRARTSTAKITLVARRDSGRP